MRSQLILLALGGVFVGVSADASVIEYSTLDGKRAAAWSDAPCSALAPSAELKVKCVDDLGELKTAIGPGGGVLLASVGSYFFEADPKDGTVYRLTVERTKEGEKITQKVIFSRVKLPPGKRLRTLVSARVQEVDNAGALVNGKTATATQGLLTLSYVVGRSADDFETFEASFDIDTLKPTISAAALRAIDTETATLGWYSPAVVE